MNRERDTFVGPPIVGITVQLEELPTVMLVAHSAEDEQRLRCWLAAPDARRRVLDVIEDALDEIAAGCRR